MSNEYFDWDVNKEEFIKIERPQLSRVNKNNIKFKIATNNDVKLLTEYKIKCSNEPEIIMKNFDEKLYQEKLIKADLDNINNFALILALYDNKVIGELDLIWHYAFFDLCKSAFIDWLYVLRDYRLGGVAKGMFEFACDILKQQDINEIRLLVGNKNLPAIGFYKTLGFDIDENMITATLKL